jgi:hypothetical protein
MEIYQRKVKRIGGGIFSAKMRYGCKPVNQFIRVFTFSFYRWIQVKQTSVANKLAMTNMFRFVTITTGMMLALKLQLGRR